jgi:hypothetical protein
MKMSKSQLPISNKLPMTNLQIFLLAPAFFLVAISAFATMPHPTPIRQENLTQRLSLQDTDKIAIQIVFPENYFGWMHAPCDYQNEITDHLDIKKILDGLSSIQEVEGSGTFLRGGLIFYRAGKEIARVGLSFFQFSPVFFLEGSRYMYGRIDDVIYKYMNADFNKARENFNRLRSRGRIY